MLSHTFFADDALLFMNANAANCRRLAHLLEMYCVASGQQTNLSKSGLIFSRNTPIEVREQVSQILGIPVSDDPGKYLGIPNMWGKSKQQALAYVKERVGKKVQGWRRNLLSFAGKEVMIKAVVNAIPLYPMTCFKFPKRTCKDLDRLISNFWWESSGTNGGIHWRAWDHVRLPKINGGMGFRDFEVLNDSLLAKTAWRLTQENNALWYKVLKGVYFPSSTFMAAEKGHRASWIWSSILIGRSMIQNDCRWLLGDGKSISIWKDVWIPQLQGKSLNQLLNCDIDSNETVDSLIAEGVWNLSGLMNMVPNDVLSIIGNLKLEYLSFPDKLVWINARNGIFTVKRGYKQNLVTHKTNMLRPGTSFVFPKEFWSNLWRIKSLPRILHFIWRCCSKAVPTKYVLFKRHCSVNPLCPICFLESESLEHLLFFCPWVRCIWFGCHLSLRIDQFNIISFEDWFSKLLCQQDALQDNDLSLLVWLLWNIWKERNEVVFNHKSPDPYAVLSKACAGVSEYWSANSATPSDQGNATCSKFVSWRGPPIGWLKINCDGSFVPKDKSAAIGVICRDSSGAFQWAFGERVDVNSAFIAELLAVRKAIMLCMDLNITAAIIETDNKDLFTCLESKSPSNSDWSGWHLLMETLDLTTSCPGLLFSFSCREGNLAADFIAVSIRKKVCPPGWVFSPTPSLIDVLKRDAVSSSSFCSVPPSHGETLGNFAREGVG